MDPPAGLASILVPCRNGLADTRLGLAALVRHTRTPWELIAVDDGSDDGTAAYLAGAQDAAPVEVTVITHPEPRGFHAACNAGLHAARGDYLVLLNNDAVVADGWLDQLVALVESDPQIGLTGPMSNYASPPQLVAEVPYTDLATMHRFAADWREAHRGEWFLAEKLSGFCLLIKRAVFEAVGGLDERFGPGFFDDDLCLRARRAGYELAVAHDCFVHHAGGRTFTALGLDVESALAKNQRLFVSKWAERGVEVPAGRPVSLRVWGPEPESIRPPVHASPATRPRVSLTMIVRDEADNLPACLASVGGLFDEVVVVDTGSTDRTIEIAREAGARVFEFPWVDDFAAARNAALARATGDYAFWLDADDRLEPPERAKLAALLVGLRPGDAAAYVVRCSCDPDPEQGGETVVDHVRLFPLCEGVRWEYRVHEQILPALRRAGFPVRWTDVVVRHVGYADLRGLLEAHSDAERQVWVADSFRGLPPPDAARYPRDAGDRHHTFAELAVSQEQVQANFARYGLLDDRVRFLPGWFRDTLPAAPIERLAVLRLDGDMYESTIVALEALYDKIAPGGYLIVDDYGGIESCRAAVHDFRAARGIREPIRSAGWTAVFWRRAEGPGEGGTP